MQKTGKVVDITDKEKHREWIDLCEKIYESVEEFDAVLIMTYRSEFHFDAATNIGINISEKTQKVLEDQNYSELSVSPTGFSHFIDIGDHENTNEIRVRNNVTNNS